jgi:hypothetical protein
LPQQLSLPPKIVEIEAKLEKFREEKVRHEVLAKTMREEEEARERRVRSEWREREI